MGLKLTDLFSSVAALSKKKKQYRKNYEERRNGTRAMIDCQPLLLPQLLLLSEPRRRSRRSREKEKLNLVFGSLLSAALEKDANSQASSKCNDSHTHRGEEGV